MPPSKLWYVEWEFPNYSRAPAGRVYPYKNGATLKFKYNANCKVYVIDIEDGIWVDVTHEFEERRAQV
jgi:hypothetical protein